MFGLRKKAADRSGDKGRELPPPNRAPNASSASARDLGERLLIGRDIEPAPAKGVELIASAAKQGDAEASRIMATLAAGGAVVPQSWSAALDHLADAADNGSASARGQLRLLSGRGGNDWTIMSREVDIAAWLAPPSRQVLCERPRIRIAQRLCSPAVCDWLIGAARGNLKPGMMYDNALKRSAPTDVRKCSQFQYDIISSDVVLMLVRARIAALTKLPTFAMEPPQIFHYKVGEEIKAHYDIVKGGDEGFGRGGVFTSDRIASSITYLNDDFEGGELEFPKAGIKHRGAKGDIIYFANLDDAGNREVNALHAGLPVLRGEKWVLSQWIHNQPFNATV